MWPPEIDPPRGGAQPEPVYSLAGGANRARPYKPLTLTLGRHRVFPDLGAREYTEFDGGDQHLFQIFNFGYGALDISDIRIGPTPVGSFDDVDIALVAGNVDVEAGAALDDTAWVERQSGADTDRIGIDLTARLFRIDRKSGDYQRHSVDVEIGWRKAGGAWTSRRHPRQRRPGTAPPHPRILSRRTGDLDGAGAVQGRSLGRQPGP